MPEIAFMPWAPIEGTLQIAEYEVWPYYSEKHNHIPDDAVIKHLDGVFGRYFEWKYSKQKRCYDDMPVESIFVITPKAFILGKDDFDQTQRQDIETIGNIIAFCGINDHPLSNLYTDNFIVYFLNFKVGEHGIHVYNTLFQSHDQLKFIKPYHLGSSVIPFDGSGFCTDLGLTLAIKDESLVKRIHRTLDLYYHTASRNEMYTPELRVLGTVMAFEVLLNFEGKREFADKIDRLMKEYIDCNQTRTIRMRDGKEEEITHSLTGWFAYDLYDLRNDIVHGKKINWQYEKYGNDWLRLEFGALLIKKIIKKFLKELSIGVPKSKEDQLMEGIMEAGDDLDNRLEELVKKFHEENKLL